MKAERIELEPRTVMGVHEVIPMSGMSDYFGRAFTTSIAEIGKQGASVSGPPLAVYHGKPTDTVDVTAGFPVAQPVTSTPDVAVITLPGGPAIETVHIGPYDTLAGTYEELMTWVEEQKLEMAEDMWEEYLTGPEGDHDPSTWRTRIVWPLA